VWNKCTTVEICQNAFRATGIFPINRFAIPDVAFAPSHTTERCLPESGGGDNTAGVGTSGATNSGDGDNAASYAIDTAASNASDIDGGGGGGSSDNMTSAFGDTLTSDEHFEFLSKSKKQPRTSKHKKSVSAAVARGSKKKSCRSSRKTMLKTIHLAVCVERNTMSHQQMNGSSVLTVNCGSMTTVVLEKLNSVITVLASKLQLLFSVR